MLRGVVFQGVLTVADFTLTAEKRDVVGKKVRRLRNAGFVPGTIYGLNNDPMTVQFNYREIQVALMKAGGTSIIDIEVDGENYPSLARDVQRDVLKGDILHVDFFAVDMNTKIRAEVPLSLIGESPLVASRKGILVSGPNSLTVEMLPDKLMDKIEVDISILDQMGATILVGDLELGDVTVLNDPEEMIAKILQSASARAADREAAFGEEGEEVSESDE